MKLYSGNEIVELSIQKAGGVDPDTMEWWIEKTEMLCRGYGVSMDDKVWADVGEDEEAFLWEFIEPLDSDVTNYDRAMKGLI